MRAWIAPAASRHSIIRAPWGEKKICGGPQRALWVSGSLAAVSFCLLWGLLKSFFLSVAFCWTVFAHYNGSILSFQQRPGGDGPFPGSKSTRGGSDAPWIPLQPCLKKRKKTLQLWIFLYFALNVPTTPSKSIKRRLPNDKVLIKSMKWGGYFILFFPTLLSLLCALKNSTGWHGFRAV